MTVVYIVIILLQIAVIAYFISGGRKKKEKAIEYTDSYEDQRLLALQVKPGQLKLSIPGNQVFVYGVVMDWNTGDTLVSLAAYITGAANLYLKSGGGVKGGGKNREVGEAAAAWVASAQDYVSKTMPVIVTEAPAAGCVRFYFLTNRQVYGVQEEVQHFDDGTSIWLPLFKKGNEVITEMMNH